MPAGAILIDFGHSLFVGQFWAILGYSWKSVDVIKICGIWCTVYDIRYILCQVRKSCYLQTWTAKIMFNTWRLLNDFSRYGFRLERWRGVSRLGNATKCKSSSGQLYASIERLRCREYAYPVKKHRFYDS